MFTAPQTLAVCAAVFTVLYLTVSVCTYLNDSKRLRQYPSLTAFSTLSDLAYIIHNAYLPKGTTRTEALHAAHQTLGPVIRLGLSS